MKVKEKDLEFLKSAPEPKKKSNHRRKREGLSRIP